jgi:oxygen-independent coproporphyrinogen-3 oxidase
MNMAVSNSHRVVLTDAQLRRLDMPGPRYTSYPTADRFVEAFGPKEYRQALRQRAQGAVVGGITPLSLYVHIPVLRVGLLLLRLQQDHHQAPQPRA